MKKQLLIVSFLMSTCSLFSAKEPITLVNAQGEFEAISGQMKEMLSKDAVLEQKKISVGSGVVYVQKAVKIIMKAIKDLPIEEGQAAEIAAKHGNILANSFAPSVAGACVVLQKDIDPSSAAYVFVAKMSGYVDTIARYVKELIKQAGKSKSLFSSLPVLGFVWNAATIEGNDRYVDITPGSKNFLEDKIVEIKKDFGRQQGVSVGSEKTQIVPGFSRAGIKHVLEMEKEKEQKLVDGNSKQLTSCAGIAMGTMGILGIVFAVGAFALSLK